MFYAQKITLDSKIPFERIRLNGISTFPTDPELFESTEWVASIVKSSAIAFSASADVRREHETANKSSKGASTVWSTRTTESYLAFLDVSKLQRPS